MKLRLGLREISVAGGAGSDVIVVVSALLVRALPYVQHQLPGNPPVFLLLCETRISSYILT